MKTITNFYQSLDTFNLIIFWGLIIVLILLFIVLMITSTKKKKTKNNNFKQEEKIVEEKLPIKEIFPEEETKPEIQEEKNELPPVTNIKQPEKFVAEEHVMEYDKEIFSVPGLKKATEETSQPSSKEELPINNIHKSIPNKPYQRNVLREMSLSQTSPIGIVKNEGKETTIIYKAQDLQKSLNTPLEEPAKKEEIPHIFNQPEVKSKINFEEPQKNNNIPKIAKEPIPVKNESSPSTNTQTSNITIKENYLNQTNNQVEKKSSPKVPEKKEPTYLEEVSKKLSETISSNEIDRTEYELRQEEEAIISYEELMKKKDSLKIIDEEEAVISIEELMQKQNKEEKLYHLTEEEENDKFIDELKNFRKDL